MSPTSSLKTPEKTRDFLFVFGGDREWLGIVPAHFPHTMREVFPLPTVKAPGVHVALPDSPPPAGSPAGMEPSVGESFV
jgi:hypothetical protein